MIHVDAKPEPEGFDQNVRQKGLAFLEQNGIALDQPLPPKTKIAPHWRDCLDDLYQRYRKTCAYLGVFFERATGGGSVDHFIAKSQRADLAYEWTNYRLASSIMNSRKGEYEDVLDPFDVETGWFHLELVSGRIFPNPELENSRRTAVQVTIDRLGLDDAMNREMRARHYQDYWERYYPEDFLRKYSPFVHSEAARQGLL